MPPEGHDPAWPDKAMFAAILLILAGAVGAAFWGLRGLIEVNQDKMPSVFTDDIAGYTITLCVATMAFGILSLWRQAAIFAYLGAACAIVSLAVFGLVPFLGSLAIVMMVLSALEGEETKNDEVTLNAGMWPDKAMAASLFMTVLGSVAITQGILMLTGHFDPILLSNATAAGIIGIVVGLLGWIAGREVYHVRRPWLGWLALAGGLATMGFYLIGPVLALIGMLLLGLAHKEDEFLLHGEDAPTTATPAKRSARRKAKARKTGA